MHRESDYGLLVDPLAGKRPDSSDWSDRIGQRRVRWVSPTSIGSLVGRMGPMVDWSLVGVAPASADGALAEAHPILAASGARYAVPGSQ